MKYTCYVISNKPHLFEPIEKSIFPETVKYFDGTGYESFSKLVNCCVADCTTETVIIMSDKVLPTSADVIKLLELLDKGFAFVALYRLAFFGFKKELLRKIGMFDERFIGGGYEDDDLYIRLKEADLAAYITEEVVYAKSKSSWNYSKSRNFFEEKWGNKIKSDNLVTRYLSEEEYNYPLGTKTSNNFLPWTSSYIKPLKVKKYQNITINKEIK